jgi:hypothetical protein
MKSELILVGSILPSMAFRRVWNDLAVTVRSHLANILAGMLLLVGPTIAHAVPVLIDFNDIAAAPSFGGTWNTIPDVAGTTQLVDATGATTNITLSFSSNWVLLDDFQINPWSHGNTAWIDGNAAMDTLNYDPGDPPGTINIAGLAANLVYRIDLLAAKDFSTVPQNATADFSIFGSFGDSVPNGDNFNVHTDGLVNGNFMTWNAVTPNANGEILIQVAGSSSPAPSSMLGTEVSAARITCLRPSAAGAPQEVSCAAAVPEPGTIALLLAIGLAGMFVHCWREVSGRRENLRLP